MSKIMAIFYNSSARSMFLLGGFSVATSLFNRIIMTKFFFDYPIVLMMMQMALTLFLIEVSRLLGMVKLPAYTFQRGKDMFLPSLMYALSSYMVLNSLDGISMPLFPPLQKLGPLLVVVIGVYFYRMQTPSKEAIVLLATISFGTALSCVNEFSIDLWSMAYGSGALGMFVLCLVMVERLHEQYSSTLELIYMNSFNCLCLFLIADLVQDEIRDSFMYLITSTTALFVTCLGVLVVLGSIFHALMFYCITEAGALHASIMHNLAGGIQIFVAYILSVYLFYDIAPSWTNIFGVVIASVASIYYYFSGRFTDVVRSGSSSRYMVMRS